MEVNDMKNERTMKNGCISQSNFFERTNKMVNFLLRLRLRKEKAQITSIRKENMTTLNLKDIKKIKGYHGQLYTNTFENLVDINKYLAK